MRRQNTGTPRAEMGSNASIMIRGSCRGFTLDLQQIAPPAQRPHLLKPSDADVETRTTTSLDPHGIKARPLLLESAGPRLSHVYISM